MLDSDSNNVQQNSEHPPVELAGLPPRPSPPKAAAPKAAPLAAPEPPAAAPKGTTGLADAAAGAAGGFAAGSRLTAGSSGTCAGGGSVCGDAGGAGSAVVARFFATVIRTPPPPSAWQRCSSWCCSCCQRLAGVLAAGEAAAPPPGEAAASGERLCALSGVVLPLPARRWEAGDSATSRHGDLRSQREPRARVPPSGSLNTRSVSSAWWRPMRFPNQPVAGWQGARWQGRPAASTAEPHLRLSVLSAGPGERGPAGRPPGVALPGVSTSRVSWRLRGPLPPSASPAGTRRA